MKLLIALSLAIALLVPMRAQAATEYILVFTTYMPYSRTVVGGPFQTYQECSAILNQESYVSGGGYSCQTIYV